MPSLINIFKQFREQADFAYLPVLNEEDVDAVILQLENIEANVGPTPNAECSPLSHNYTTPVKDGFSMLSICTKCGKARRL